MTRLAGKRAVVTGAAHGIGKAIAERFVAEGASVVLADIDGTAVAEVAERLRQTAIVTDVASKDAIDALFDRVEGQWGGLDILVNNAGVTHRAELLDLTETDLDRVIAINLKSAIFCTQRAAAIMEAGGAIINMSSVNAVLAIPTQIPYAITKGALRQLTNVSALSLAARKIRVNAIGPGTIKTAVADAIIADASARREVLSRTPLGRFGTTQEVAAISVFLASDDASYITGQTVYADGGRLGLNYTVPVGEDG